MNVRTLPPRDLYAAVVTQELLDARVSVVIPTYRRSAFLPQALASLARQTVRPAEVIIVDQDLDESERQKSLDAYPTLSVRWLSLRHAGQSYARNHGVARAKHPLVLLLDDDSELEEDALEMHLRVLFAYGADASTGHSTPPTKDGLGRVPASASFIRSAEEFDTGNALVRRKAFELTGGFDPVFNLGNGADRDFGLRLVAAGHIVLNNPYARRLHHKAEAGGLRSIGALWGARGFRWFRPFPSYTSCYLLKKHFKASGVAWSLFQTFVKTLIAMGTSEPKGVARLIAIPIRVLGAPIIFFKMMHSLQVADALLAKIDHEPSSN